MVIYTRVSNVFMKFRPAWPSSPTTLAHTNAGYIDRTAPHTRERWIGTTVLVAVFLLRIVLAQGVRTRVLSVRAHLLNCLQHDLQWYIVCCMFRVELQK